MIFEPLTCSRCRVQYDLDDASPHVLRGFSFHHFLSPKAGLRFALRVKPLNLAVNPILLIGLTSFLHGSRSLSRYRAPQFLQTLRVLWCVMRGPSPRIFGNSHVACAPAVIILYPAVLSIMPSSSLSISLLFFISSCSAVVLHDTSSPRPRQGLFGAGNRISSRR